MRWTCAYAVWLTLLPGCTASTPVSAEGFQNLFDGQTLDGWRGDENFWRVEDGTIVAESTEANPCRDNTFLVWDQGEVDDFELRLKFRITGSDSANSGIQFRGVQREDGHVVGYQADIDKKGQWVGCLYDEAMPRKMLAQRGQKVSINAAGERKTEQFGDAAELFAKHVNKDGWNEYTITARGPVITLALNGHKTIEVVDNEPSGLDRYGLLALQLHSGPPMKVEFKDIQFKRFPLEEGWKKVVFVAGSPSHGYFSHEHNAGCKLLAGELNAAAKEHGLKTVATVYTNGWPKDPTAMDNADCVVSYCDGGARHYLNDRLADFDHLVNEQGVGLVCLHYGVETTIGDCGQHFLKWIGGYFEPDWSVNPHWTAKFDEFPEHPTTRGVKPFEINDEWYYHMRFVDGMKGVTPILTDLPPRESLSRPDGHHSGNPFVRDAVLEKKEPQHVAWAYDRPNGKGRGFGFTGGHFHQNWQDDNFRKVVLNAIVWAANGEVPADGVPSATPTQAELEANQDEPKPQPKPDRKSTQNRPKNDKPVSVATPTKAVSDASKMRPGPTNGAAPGSHESSAALEQLDVHPDLDATLFASEPMMTNPTSIDVDHLGRVWVCEGINYRAFRNADVIGELAKEGDRILILEDTSGDGIADKSTVFHQSHDVDSAQGILVLPTPNGKGLRALVSAGDSIFYLIDDDGDLTSDRKEVLFTGISGSQHDHGIHACHFGPDGKLYFNFGNEGKQIKDKDGKPIVDRMGNEVNNSRKPYQEGMVFRCNLDGSELETLAWDFRNNWEVCVDSFGNIWQSDNDDDGNRGVRINFVMEYGNYGYKDELTGAGWKEPRTNLETEIPLQHWHLNDPGVVPNLLQTGAGAPTGICFYEGTLFPEIFHHAIIHCDAGVNVCRAYIPKPDGAGYTAEVVNILDGTRNKWFRPSDVCVAPDGSLLVADWYDPGVGGHRMQDVGHGRIFHVAPKSHAGKYSAPQVDVSTPAGAVAALKSPNMSTRYLGWSALDAMGDTTTGALETLLQDENPLMRARALGALVKQREDKKRIVAGLNVGLSDKSSDFCCFAIRLSRQLAGIIELADIEHAIDITDPSPAVRREQLIGLRELFSLSRDGKLVDAWVALAKQHDGKDRWYLEAIGIAADGHWDRCLAAYLSAVGKNWMDDEAARDIVWRSRADATPVLLAELVTNPSIPVEELPRYLRALDFQRSSEKDEAIMQLAFAPVPGGAAREALVHAEALGKLAGFDIGSKPEYKAALVEVLNANQGTPQFVRLVGKFSVSDRYADLLHLAQKDPQSQVAVEAIQTLLQKGQQKLIQAALNNVNDPALVQSTIDALATSGDGRAATLLEKAYEDDHNPFTTRRAALKGMGSIRQGAVLLREIAEKGHYDNRFQDTLAATLHTVQWKDIKEFASKKFPLPPGKDSEPLPPISELASRSGDKTHGSVLFHSTATCAQCHQVGMLGKNVGPNLSEIGAKLSREALFESILYPSAAISHNYENWLVVDENGNQFTGLLVSETDAVVELKDAKGLVRTVPKLTIEIQKKQDISLMPADIQKTLSVQDLVDIVEYLSTLKPVGKE
ncbi:MAG: PVC-type heme-binding CxxCH protein [Planctomycetaceae bacterium]